MRSHSKSDRPPYESAIALKIDNIPVFIVTYIVVFTIVTGVILLWVLCLNPTYKIGDRSVQFLMNGQESEGCQVSMTN
ncbi:MAG: hypothetical protein KME09_04030 [Pleurocapsa minor HA4230-MV1]|nr:hypothetical protein [Pleurocapsa minor HA4230-MV1]